ncbi:hypothetical protein L3X38_039209 [Prunus dulcis]|uniref:Uncharacterized protein n=1 Tax=Prunus dulcis TaxID=3755 RepID=A0AAD4V8V8_PRUDU|nr:hypothetical protein L3X38_039209 [Prunus dulcis]
MTLYMMVARCCKSKIQTLEEPSPHGLHISECLERKLCNRMQGNFRKEQAQYSVSCNQVQYICMEVLLISSDAKLKVMLLVSTWARVYRYLDVMWSTHSEFP